MSSAGGEGPSQSRKGKEREADATGGSGRQDEGVQVLEVDLGDLYGASAGWVEARTSCPHLPSMPATGTDDLARVPPPDSPCSRLGASLDRTLKETAWRRHRSQVLNFQHLRL